MNKIIRYIKQKLNFSITTVILILLILWASYLRFGQNRGWAAWTGFGAFTDPFGEYQRGKTFWDFLELLVIPIALAITAYLFTKSENNRQREFELERIRETAFQEYISQIDDLIKSGLIENDDNALPAIARSRTLSILKILDGRRKGLVIHYLASLKLIQKKKETQNGKEIIRFAKVSLTGADLSNMKFFEPEDKHFPKSRNEFRKSGYYLNLCNVDFSNSNLSNSRFYGVDLDNTVFYKCNLYNAIFQFAYSEENTDFRRSNLEKAKILHSIFKRGNFAASNMSNSEIEDSEFYGSNFFSYGQGVEIESLNVIEKADFSNSIMISSNFWQTELLPEQLKSASQVINLKLPSMASYNKNDPVFIWELAKITPKWGCDSYKSFNAYCPLCNKELEGEKFREFWGSLEEHLQNDHGKPYQVFTKK